MMVGVSSRTRSKKVPLFSPNCSSSKRKKSNEDVMSLESVSGSKRRKVKVKSFVFPKNHEVIFIDEDEYDQDGSEYFDVDGKKEGKIDESGNKGANFVDDEKCGWVKENPITIDEDDEGDDVKVDGSGEFLDKNENFIDLDDSDESDEDDDSDESDEDDTSDEDFRVDKVNEIIDSDDDSSSDSFVDDVDDEEEVEEEEKTKKGSRKYFNVVEELAREVNDEKSGEEKENVNEISDSDDGSSNDVDDDEVMEEEEMNVNEISDSDDGNLNDVDEEEEVREKEKEVNEISNCDVVSSNDVDDVEKEEVRGDEEKGLQKPNNVVEEEVEEEVREEEKEKVNEISNCDVVSSNDVDDVEEEEVREDDEKGLQKPNNVVEEEVEEEVREEEKEKVNEISNCDVVSSNDVDDVEEEEVREDDEKGLQKPNNVVEDEVEEEVREEEKEKVNEIFGNDDNESSNDVIVDNVEVKVRDEEKKGVEEDKAEDLDPLWQERNNCLMEEEEQLRQVKEEEQLRDAKDKKRGISRKNIEKKKIKTSSSVYKEVEHSDYGSATASTTFNPMKGSCSKRNEASETHKAKNVEMKVKNVSPNDDNVNVSVAKSSAKPVENVNVGDSVKGKEQHVKGLGCSSKRNEASETYKAKKVENVSHDDDNVSVAKSKAENSAKPIENVNAGDSVKGKEQHGKGFGCSSSKRNETSETHKAKNVEMKVENVSHDDDNAAKSKAKDSAKPTKNLKVGDSVEGKEKHVTGLGVGGVSSVQIKQEMVEDLDKQEMMEDKPREECKGKINIQNGVKKESVDYNGLNQRGKTTHAIPKKLPLAQYLAELYRSNKEDTVKNESIVLEMNDDSVDLKDTPQPPVCAETPSLIWSLKRVVQKTEEEKEMDKELEKNKLLWDEMERAIRESEAESEIGNLGTNRSPPPRCEHITLLDEQLGVYCKLCGDVITEIKYITELVWDRYPNESSRRRATVGEDNVSLFDRSHFNVSDDESKDNVSHTEVTVWDKIPGVKQTLYPHQQEGFEFIWKNLAGSIELQKLKNVDPNSEGGCIISHAPGTGKTRLTIVFLKAYLKLFPKCLPIVVAPASLLLTWEEEFKKWDIGVPFHNLSSLDLSGKEHPDVFGRFDRFNARHRNDETRMAKLISWFKETSILGISYSLYGSICQDKEKKKNQSVKERTGDFDIRKVLLKAPGLLVLDEGHTPRNQRSKIWKVLTKKSQTQKRIILSGTPFQNNFTELYGTLSLVKPSFPNMIPPELKTFCHKQRRISSKKLGWEAVSGNIERDPSDDAKIEKLKLLMDPFVHVHKGAILESKLPGLKQCLVTLKADSLQTEILNGIKRSQNSIFNFERKIALTSVHPSLFLECDLSKKEESLLDKDQLKQLRPNPHKGVKTKFVYEFVRLCNASNEKVLVFSQFHAPLLLIQDQLNSAFNWSNEEVLFMSSRDSTKVKQSIIHSFNDENSKAKVLLAATKACSEGISLVGASRVVLLDVVWNPSVERQAISRAYRIGQKKVVYTYHLLAEGTTEAEKYGKQAEKDRLSELLFSAKHATDNDVSKRRAVNFEDEILGKMTRHEKLIDMFVKCVVLRKERDLV